MMEPSNSHETNPSLNQPSELTVFIATIGCCSGLIGYIVSTAWLCDDAYITLRTVDHFLQGFGLRWNIAERVQTYTHPLWMFVLSFLCFCTGEFYYTVLAANLALSASTVGLLAFVCASTFQQALIAIVLLWSSKAFVDFSTSGLENPLSHFLLLVLFLFYRAIHPSEKFTNNKILSGLFLASGLLVLNRLDTALLVAPVVLYCLYRAGLNKTSGYALFLGLVPAAGWELFSLLYYGFPFPNTAYAKLETGIEPIQLVRQGYYYLLNSIRWDPISLSTIAATAAIAMALRQKTKPFIPWMIGIFLYLAYIVSIGGDFMSGRFLSLPFLVSVLVISQLDWKISSRSFILFIASVMLPLTAGNYYRSIDLQNDRLIDSHGIADERKHWSPATGLFVQKQGAIPNHSEAYEGIRDRERGVRFTYRYIIGMYGFYAGSQAHIIDRCALADPLLARLPVVDKENWRIGHFERNTPVGYQEHLAGIGEIENRSLREYWEKLSVITHNEIWDLNRLWIIWEMNTGKYDRLIKDYIDEIG